LIDARYQLQVARIALEQLMGLYADNTSSWKESNANEGQPKTLL
jgi:hypothetical protein